MATAKHRAIDVLRRERTARTFAPELGRLLESEWTLVPVVEELFGAHAVKDDLLRMMFSCCHPAAARGSAGRARAAHPLRLQRQRSRGCVSRAANAAIEKRISRAKKVLAGSKTAVRCIGCRRLFRRVFRPSSARSTCSLTRAITARPPSRPCVPSSARKPCVLRRCSSSIRRRQRRQRTRLPRSCASTRRACRARRRVGQPELAVRSGSIPLGSRLVAEGQSVCSIFGNGPGADRISRRGRHRVGPCDGPSHRGHGLGKDRFALRHADDDSPFPGRCVESRHRHRAARRARNAGSKRFAPSPTAIASPATLSSTPRWANSNFTAGDMKSPASTSERRSTSRAIPWSDNSSSSAWARANAPRRSVRWWRGARRRRFAAW